MSKCAKPTNKRPPEDALDGPAKKMPKAGDIVVDAPVPRATSNRAANAPVVVCLYKWCDKASDVFPDLYAERDAALYQR